MKSSGIQDGSECFVLAVGDSKDTFWGLYIFYTRSQGVAALVSASAAETRTLSTLHGLTFLLYLLIYRYMTKQYWNCEIKNYLKSPIPFNCFWRSWSKFSGAIKLSKESLTMLMLSVCGRPTAYSALTAKQKGHTRQHCTAAYGIVLTAYFTLCVAYCTLHAARCTLHFGYHQDINQGHKNWRRGS